MSAKDPAPDLLFSIVMPAFNEEAVIEATISDLCAHLDATDFRYELVVVDDGSTDGTADILARLSATCPALIPLRNDGPGGYGFAIRRGLESYKGDAVAIVNSDGADAPKDVAAYFGVIAQGYDCAFGTRFGPDSNVTNYPPFKRFINRIANFVLALLTGSRYRDFTNGFKCYRRDVVDGMQPLVAGQFNITIEMSLKAVLSGWSYLVVPTDWQQRAGGKSSFRLFALIKPYTVTLIYCLSRRYLSALRR